MKDYSKQCGGCKLKEIKNYMEKYDKNRNRARIVGSFVFADDPIHMTMFARLDMSSSDNKKPPLEKCLFNRDAFNDILKGRREAVVLEEFASDNLEKALALSINCRGCSKMKEELNRMLTGEKIIKETR